MTERPLEELYLRMDDRNDSVNAVCFTRACCDANSAVIESLHRLINKATTEVFDLCAECVPTVLMLRASHFFSCSLVTIILINSVVSYCYEFVGLVNLI